MLELQPGLEAHWAMALKPLHCPWLPSPMQRPALQLHVSSVAAGHTGVCWLCSSRDGCICYTGVNLSQRMLKHAVLG